MRSLTSILPEIAPVLGLSTQALYERQRVLIRLGLLPAPEGRGKRSGAAASPETVALLVVAAMVTDNLSETDDRVRDLASAAFVDKKKSPCPWTGATTFKDALAFILTPAASNSARRRSIPKSSIRVLRSKPAALIHVVDWPKIADPRSRGSGFSEFGEFHRRPSDRLNIEAELPSDALARIRDVLSNEGSL